MIDLKALPPPKVVEEPEFEVIRDALVAGFKEISPNYAYFVPGDPVMELLEVIAYRELIWRNRNNEVAMANLLAFAAGADLDHLGSFAPFGGVARMVVTAANPDVLPPIVEVKEDDDSYRRRIQLALASPSTAGPVERYEFLARSASPLVRDVLVFSPDFPNGFNMGGRVNIVILSREGNGVPTLNLLQTVTQAVTAEDAGVMTDVVTVEPCRLKNFILRVEVTLYPDTPVTLFNNLTPLFQTEWAKVQSLGYELTESWVDSKLHLAGVQNVNVISPSFPFSIEPYEFPSIETLEIVFAGFYYGAQYNAADLQLTGVYNQVYAYYRNYAIRTRRTMLQILSDLTLIVKAGVIQPSLTGFATYLGIQKVIQPSGAALPADEIAAAIHYVLSAEYDKVLT